MIYLYLKVHNTTGLKYLGKTISKDPHKYTGSGKVWLRHIKKHGYDVTTTILLETESEQELHDAGIYYSDLWNVVESKEFANIIREEGSGGAQLWSEESRKKVSDALKGKPKNDKSKYSQKDPDRRKLLSIKAKEYLSDPDNLALRRKQLRENWDAEKVSKSMSQLKWCNDGVRSYRLKEVPEGYSLGRIYP